MSEQTLRGGSDSWQRLAPLVYTELHAIAERALRRERPGHTLQATALVHEALLRMREQHHVSSRNRLEFLAGAAHMVRRILLDHARARVRLKRGDPDARITLSDDLVLVGRIDLDLLALHEALEELAAVDAELAKLVEMRFFGGLSLADAGAVLGHAPAVAKRHWIFARSWLRKRLRTDPEDAP